MRGSSTAKPSSAVVNPSETDRPIRLAYSNMGFLLCSTALTLVTPQ